VPLSPNARQHWLLLVADKPVDASATITREEYSQYFTWASAALSVNLGGDPFGELTPEAVAQRLPLDWSRDTGSPTATHMDFGTFYSAVYEMVDTWTDTADLWDYLRLLDLLYAVISEAMDAMRLAHPPPVPDPVVEPSVASVQPAEPPPPPVVHTPHHNFGVDDGGMPRCPACLRIWTWCRARRAALQALQDSGRKPWYGAYSVRPDRYAPDPEPATVAAMVPVVPPGEDPLNISEQPWRTTATGPALFGGVGYLGASDPDLLAQLVRPPPLAGTWGTGGASTFDPTEATERFLAKRHSFSRLPAPVTPVRLALPPRPLPHPGSPGSPGAARVSFPTRPHSASPALPQGKDPGAGAGAGDSASGAGPAGAGSTARSGWETLTGSPTTPTLHTVTLSVPEVASPGARAQGTPVGTALPFRRPHSAGPALSSTASPGSARAGSASRTRRGSTAGGSGPPHTPGSEAGPGFVGLLPLPVTPPSTHAAEVDSGQGTWVGGIAAGAVTRRPSLRDLLRARADADAELGIVHDAESDGDGEGEDGSLTARLSASLSAAQLTPALALLHSAGVSLLAASGDGRGGSPGAGARGTGPASRHRGWGTGSGTKPGTGTKPGASPSAGTPDTSGTASHPMNGGGGGGEGASLTASASAPALPVALSPGMLARLQHIEQLRLRVPQPTLHPEALLEAEDARTVVSPSVAGYGPRTISTTVQATVGRQTRPQTAPTGRSPVTQVGAQAQDTSRGLVQSPGSSSTGLGPGASNQSRLVSFGRVGSPYRSCFWPAPHSSLKVLLLPVWHVAGTTRWVRARAAVAAVVPAWVPASARGTSRARHREQLAPVTPVVAPRTVPWRSMT
jgi:hypothetical protein